MKILIIPSWYPTPNKPLDGSFFREQAEFLHKEGVAEIKVLYGDEQSTPFFKLILIYALSFFKRKLSIHQNLVVQSPMAFGFIIPKNRRLPEKYKVKLARKLYINAYRTFVEENWNPDLIHAQSGMDAGIYTHDIYKSAGIPFVIIEHQVFVFHYYSRFRAKLVVQAFEAAKKTAAVSFDERRQVLMNQTECNPEVIWNFVNEMRYQIQLEKRNKEFTIITILNSLPIKGAETFIEAILKLSKITKDFKFIMVGKGADEKSKDASSNLFVKKSKELAVYEYGSFIPFLKREKISDILNKAHVFVSPTIQEPHGIAVREAMMCGLPIISTANGGVEDSISVDTGLIVPVKSPQALANAIFQVKTNYASYDPNIIRNTAVDQCGRETFLKSMSDFYLK